MSELWNNYFKNVKTSYKKGTEYTPRAYFQNLLESINENSKINIIHEPKRKEGFGAPDFKTELDGAIIGYIETKSINENLDKVLKSTQIKKYLSITNNLIITNYLEFILVKEQKIIERSTLFYLTDIEGKTTKLKSENIESTQKIFKRFFISQPIKIGDAKELAVQLAERGKVVKEYINEILEANTNDNFSQKIIGLYDAFKKTLVEDLTKEEFADAYAQTVLYGFFLAYLQSGKKISIEDASRLVPQSFKVIKEFFNLINDYNIPSHIKWIFQEIINLINNIDLIGIYESISFKSRQVNAKDPYLYFYETFLGEFDAKKKKSKGVYYTPIQVVSFITRSINLLLEKNFSKEKGFADSSVTVLDFATGTGTFLVSIFELIFEKILNDKGKFKKLVKEHLLKNFFGFEYLVAPYAVAHLKLSQLLKDNGYLLQEDERLQIFLTDTLDNSEHKAIPLLPYLSQEGKEATQVKVQKKILVITGNPPYNNKSRNNKDWICGLIKTYKPEGEKKLNLDDDYIKFIRYAHWKITQSNQGIIGIITNNSFLNGLTHRKMREELIRNFDEIYILNLHGNSRIGETSPDGSIDENVFDIMQGVSINIFVKKEKKENNCQIFYADVFGKREDKYKYLLENNINKVKWEELNLKEFDIEFKKTQWGTRFKENLNFFVPMQNAKIIKKYGEFWGMKEIFKEYNSGIQTKRDELTIKFSKLEVEKTINDFKNYSDDEIRIKYSLPPDNDGWQLPKAKEVLEGTNYDTNNIKTIHYRPFDLRFTYYCRKQGFLGRPRYDTLQHFVNNKNLGLCFIRNDYGAESFNYALISDKIVDIHCIGGQTYITPLYLYQDTSNLFNLNKDSNFNENFENFINNKYSYIPTPEEIISYIYAVLYSPTYRKKYLEFLKIDFPHIPFIEDEKFFKQLSKLGSELIQHHLMKCTYSDNQITFPVENNDIVENVRFVENKNFGKVYINKFQYFDNVSFDIWDFYIGGYQVLDKWLKSRKNRSLSYQEQEMFIKICNIIKFTIFQMYEIDKITNLINI